MNAIAAAAQQAERANATTLILEAMNTGLINPQEANNLTDEHIEEIGILETPEQVGNYVFRLFRETPQQRAARRVQEQAALQQLRETLRNEVQLRADARAGLINGNANGNANGDANGMIEGGKRRRRRTRKARRYF